MPLCLQRTFTPCNIAVRGRLASRLLPRWLWTTCHLQLWVVNRVTQQTLRFRPFPTKSQIWGEEWYLFALRLDVFDYNAACLPTRRYKMSTGNAKMALLKKILRVLSCENKQNRGILVVLNNNFQVCRCQQVRNVVALRWIALSESNSEQSSKSSVQVLTLWAHALLT